MTRDHYIVILIAFIGGIIPKIYSLAHNSEPAPTWVLVIALLFGASAIGYAFLKRMKGAGYMLAIFLIAASFFMVPYFDDPDPLLKR